MRVLVVDDESPARQRLIHLLNDIGDIEIVGEATNGLDALEKIEIKKPDLVFLDIEMPGLDGLEVARSLWANSPAIVFATAYDQFALEAFDLAALDYIVKPISKERLDAAINKVKRTIGSLKPDFNMALSTLKQSGNRIAVRTGSNFEIIRPKEVSAILAQEHYSVIISGTQELLSEESLDALERRLAPNGFLRVHRSAIINLNFLVRLERLGDRKYNAILSDTEKTEVPISRDRLSYLKAHLNIV